MDDTNPYARLASAVLLPPLASAITNEWEPRNPEPLLRFMEAWAELLPPGLLRHILDNLVFPKVRPPWLPMPCLSAGDASHARASYIPCEEVS